MAVSGCVVNVELGVNESSELTSLLTFGALNVAPPGRLRIVSRTSVNATFVAFTVAPDANSNRELSPTPVSDVRFGRLECGRAGQAELGVDGCLDR